ncbi:MAG TPA: ferritin-like domain-containing protein [Usitatibacteraceae bacterium]|nr:ferritin-like domain-containing protein [Usitatibacteraceae bacterium]
MDNHAIRRQARQNLGQGAVTAGYGADRSVVLRRLNDALATEIVCALRYRRHHFMARGMDSKGIADEFLVHSNEELGHADLLAGRIVQLSGEPDLAPAGLASRSHAEYVVGANLVDMIHENLIAERIAIESYREFIRFLGDQDSTTRRLLESILAVEEEHADELAALLPETGENPRPQTQHQDLTQVA